MIISLLTTGFCVSVSALVIYDGDFGFEVNASKGEAKLVRYNGNGGAVTLPESFRDYPVTVIDRNAFKCFFGKHLSHGAGVFKHKHHR